MTERNSVDNRCVATVNYLNCLPQVLDTSAPLHRKGSTLLATKTQDSGITALSFLLTSSCRARYGIVSPSHYQFVCNFRLNHTCFPLPGTTSDLSAWFSRIHCTIHCLLYVWLHIVDKILCIYEVIVVDDFTTTMRTVPRSRDFINIMHEQHFFNENCTFLRKCSELLHFFILQRGWLWSTFLPWNLTVTQQHYSTTRLSSKTWADLPSLPIDLKSFYCSFFI